MKMFRPVQTKKISLEQTWRLCLKMWKWIALKYLENPQRSVNNLKQQWLDENGFDSNPIQSGCFFCHYKGGDKDCIDNCPGVLIDQDFFCTYHEYDYWSQPLAFYQELLRLNHIRKYGE